MSLRDRFRAFLHPYPAEDRASDELLELGKRVAELEAREVAHDVAWSEAKDQIARHLKRVAAIEQRSGQRDTRADLTQQLLDLKLRNRGA